jgi:hypothetical protein
LKRATCSTIGPRSTPGKNAPGDVLSGTHPLLRKPLLINSAIARISYASRQEKGVALTSYAELSRQRIRWVARDSVPSSFTGTIFSVQQGCLSSLEDLGSLIVLSKLRQSSISASALAPTAAVNGVLRTSRYRFAIAWLVGVISQGDWMMMWRDHGAKPLQQYSQEAKLRSAPSYALSLQPRANARYAGAHYREGHRPGRDRGSSAAECHLLEFQVVSASLANVVLHHGPPHETIISRVRLRERISCSASRETYICSDLHVARKPNAVCHGQQAFETPPTSHGSCLSVRRLEITLILAFLRPTEPRT